MKDLSENLFRAVCGLFSAAVLVLSLLTSVKLAQVNDEAARLEKQAEALEEENRILSAQLESSLSLEELERRATQDLGMQRRTPGQVYYLTLPEG